MAIDKNHVRELLGYMIWADEQMCAAAATVSDEGYYREQGISLGSVHKSLVHTMGAQWVWLTRWRNEKGQTLETHVQYPTRESLLRRWPEVHAAMREFLERQTDQSLAMVCTFQNSRGETISLPLGQLMVYVVDHGTYHRGQINSMIKVAGGKPWGGAMYHYFLQQGQQ